MAGHYRILTINGGGVKGIVPARILQKLTDDSGKPINELFDYIVGTSIGGIIAVSLTASDEHGKPKYTTKDVVDILKNEAQYIFPPNALGNWPIIGSLHNLFFPKYSREGIDNLLDAKLGNATFRDTIMPVTTVSYSLDKDHPRTWTSFKAYLDQDKYNYKLKDAAGATSAAPTFFPPKITQTANGDIYHDIDGGIFANSPTFMGIAELVNAHPEIDPHKLIVVSIGTGIFNDKPIAHNAFPLEFNLPVLASITSALGALSLKIFYGSHWQVPLLASGLSLALELVKGYGQAGWVISHDLIGKMMKGTELSDAIESLALFKGIRINPSLDEKYSVMDNGNPEHMQNFTEAIETYIENNPKIWENVLQCLMGRDFHSVACAKARETEESKMEFKNIGGGLEQFIDVFTLVDTSIDNSDI